MKRQFLLSFILLISFTFLNTFYGQINQTWKWMHPKPHGNTLRYVKAFSANNIVAVGYAGTFMSTTNGGTTWNVYTNAGSAQAWGLGKSLYSGWFFNMSTGLVCGSSGWIARTTNGGLNWDSISSAGSTATLYGIHFINTTTGFIGGTSGTVLKTTDAGLTWTAIPTGGTLSIYNIFAVDANNIYAPTSSSGVVLITTNGGTNWVSSSSGGRTLYDANFMNANTGFVLGSSGHIKSTTNGGLNWTSINVPSVTSTFYELYVSSTTTGESVPYFEGFEATTFPPTGWRTVNTLGALVWVRYTGQFHSGTASAEIDYQGTGGDDWLITPRWNIAAGDSLVFWLRPMNVGWIPDSLAVRVSTTDSNITSFNTRILYIAEGNGYPSTTTWQRYAVSLNSYAGQGIFIGFRHGDLDGDGICLDDISVVRPEATAAVYAVGDAFYIYKTVNMGANWTQMDFLDPTQTWTSTYYSMDINGTMMTAVGASGLVNRSTNNGANWVNYNTWLLSGTFYDVWAEYNDGKILAVGSGGNDTKVIYSSNGGTTWVPRNIVTTKYFRSISMVNANTGYIAGSSGAMYKTTNGGANWDSLPFPGTSALIYKVEFVNATTGWAASSSSTYLWKTTDAGMNWVTQTGPTAAVYSIDMVDANTGIYVGTSGSIRKTTDGGTTWTALTPGTTSTLYDVKMLDANTGFITGSSVLRKTTNGGTTWDSIGIPYSTTMYGMDWVNANTGILAGSSTGFTCRTTNGGTTWSIETTSGSTMYNVQMTHADSAWAVGSIQGVFKWAKGMTGVTTWNSQVPSNYYLAQNYPNPFNPSTTIKFGIPKAGKVNLKVYDITGRVVADLLNNVPLNAGNVTTQFDGTNFASGVYFYTLTVNDERIDTKKMILVK